jgi:D-beta-D-heptose 7-phosphate kinase/D-beta-D-heptose 1-phosphate adenosyltransferase
MDTREKIVSRDGLHAILDEHRRAGRKIVFANGVFDLLHAGHVRYLREIGRASCRERVFDKV